MKRVNHLYKQLITFDNMHLAFKKAFKGTNKNRDTLQFYFNYEYELLQLIEQLKTNTYFPAGYRDFVIKDPKERVISVAPFRDRIVHHAIINVIEPIFEKSFYYHSYACRKGKGTHKAITQAQKYLKQNKWFLKSDISKYFASIDHDILIAIIERKIKDKQLLQLIEKVIRNNGEKEKGLPIGNLTSQFFANVYLDPLDHFIKDELRIKYYIRYMDDFVIFSNNKTELKWLKDEIKRFLNENLDLSLKESATYINQRLNGLSFLGRRIFPQTIRIKRENLKRCIKKIRKREYEYTSGNIDDTRYSQSMSSLWGYISSANTFNLCKHIIK